MQDSKDSPLTWYRHEPEEVLDSLDSCTGGLGEEQARERLERIGRNRIGRRRKVSPWQVLLHQFKSPLIYVLFGALLATVVTSIVTEDWRFADIVVIGIVLVVNSTVGFFQEYRAERAVESLMRIVAPRATVRRDGEVRTVKAEELVPGDVVELKEGNVVPADMRIIAVKALQVDEAALTGESVPVNKSDNAIADAGDDLPAADQTNMAFMGTAVTSGQADGVVVATGRATQIGRIAEKVQEADATQTPLQRRIQRLALWITVGILLVAVAAFAVGLLMGRDWAQMITLAVALAVAAIPAGLPIVVTVALAIGVRRMARRHAVIRHLPAVDTLGSCTTILSDKTGTLTQNRMTVRALYADGARYDLGGGAKSRQRRWTRDSDAVEVEDCPALRQTLLIGMLCNDAAFDEGEEEEPSGDPMETALIGAAHRGGLERQTLAKEYPRADEVPFQTEKRFMATIHDVPEEDGGPLVLVKGAPEAVLAMCRDALADDGETCELDREEVMARNDAFAGQGLRVLAMAMSRGEDAVRAAKAEQPERVFTFVGLQGMLDPPRPSAIRAVDRCHEAGIRVVMVTGDHARTASAIAHDVHLDRPVRTSAWRKGPQGPGGGADHKRGEQPETHPEACTGQDVSGFSDEQLDDELARTNVFARVEPIQKTRLVERLKAQHEIVAVTGDGVNDAPALKAAHIGAAMGSGTDVAKETSDMVITDDNFASVYGAVEQGRTAFRNIRMATFFLLSTGAAMVLVILIALALGWPLPLLPAQILWCNVVTNGIADVALAFEPGEKALYRRPPRPPSEGILDRILIERLVIVGLWLALGTLVMFLWAWGFDFRTWESGSDENLTLASTTALTTMVLFQKVHVFNCRSEDVSIFGKSLLTNKVLLLGVLTSLAVHVAAVYLPWTQTLLTLAPLDWNAWLSAVIVAASAIVVNELHKRLRRPG